MTWLSSFAIILAVGAIAIAAARFQVGHSQNVARDEARFEMARTIDHEPIVGELRRGGAL